MNTLIVGFSRSKKKFPIGSILIRLYQGWVLYSHVYIRMKSSKSVSDNINHASEGLVFRMSETEFNKKHIIFEEYEVEIPDIQVFNPHRQSTTNLVRYIKDEMHELAGADYSIRQNVGLVLVDLLSLFNIKISNPWKEGWNCSEFVMNILDEIYPKEFLHLKKDTVTPKDIHKILNYLGIKPR